MILIVELIIKFNFKNGFQAEFLKDCTDYFEKFHLVTEFRDYVALIPDYAL